MIILVSSLADATTISYMQRYRSGHNEAVLKTVCPRGRVGSNPTLCVIRMKSIKHIGTLYSCKRIYIEENIHNFGEVPKRLKGLPWKGSRSLIAVRGFKSRLLRSKRKIENYSLSFFFGVFSCYNLPGILQGMQWWLPLMRKRTPTHPR